MKELLEVRSISKSYGEKQVVSDVSFSLSEGEILGFLGPNGAGKSTTIAMITSIIESDAGEILFYGKHTKENMNEFKSILGVVPQDLAIYEDLSAYDNVKFFCSLYNFKGRELNNRTKQALEFVGLWDKRNGATRKFSGGMKRRLNIACSIAHSPKLLIMDEPTVGIDPQSRNHIMEAIRTLNANGTAVIYVSHYMEEIENLCERVVIVDEGKMLENKSKEELKEKYKKMGFNNLEEIFLYLTGTALRDKEN